MVNILSQIIKSSFFVKFIIKNLSSKIEVSASIKIVKSIRLNCLFYIQGILTMIMLQNAIILRWLIELC